MKQKGMNSIMKRFQSCAVLLLALLLLALAGCSGGEKQVDAAALADELKNGLTFKDEMTAAEDTVRDALYAIDGADVAQGKLYTSSGATAEEIAVFKAGDKEAADRLYKAVQERLKNQKTAFEDYVPAEMTKLNNAVLVKKGTMVVLCVADDYAAAKKIVDKALG